jgi:hypothetical protein
MRGKLPNPLLLPIEVRKTAYPSDSCARFREGRRDETLTECFRRRQEEEEERRRRG